MVESVWTKRNKVRSSNLTKCIMNQFIRFIQLKLLEHISTTKPKEHQGRRGLDEDVLRWKPLRPSKIEHPPCLVEHVDTHITQNSIAILHECPPPSTVW